MATSSQTFVIKVENLDKLISQFKGMDSELNDALKDAVSQASAVVVREAKRNSERGGTSFPHRITSNLINSIKEIRSESKPGRATSEVGSDMVYAARLEFGFMDTDRLGRRYNQGPRAFLRPAIDENEDEIKKAFETTIQGILKKYTS